jgi:hypothetical protein
VFSINYSAADKKVSMDRERTCLLPWRCASCVNESDENGELEGSLEARFPKTSVGT